MSTAALVRTSTFRLALFYSGVFCVSGLVLLGVIYWLTVGFMQQQSDESIRSEYRGLLELERHRGTATLAEAIRSRSGDQSNYLYLLVDSELHPVAGNLEAWPRPAPSAQGWVEFAVESAHKSDREMRENRALTVTLPDGYRLLVGKNVHDLKESRELIFASLGWIIAVMIGLGLAGGWVVSRYIMRRVDAINQTTQEIVGGDLRARMPMSSRGDEFDQMSENVNRMLDRIEHLMDGMKQVSDGIAHDLRSPLTRLRNRLELSLLGQGDSDQHRAAMEDALADTESLLATFNALLSIAQAEAGAARRNMALADLGKIAKDVADLYEPAAQAKEISLKCEIQTQPAMIYAQKHLLAQALANLVDNAIKFTPVGGAVTLQVREIGNHVEVMVADTGPGIPATDRERAFHRFVRLDNAADVPGSGLGLSVAAAVARLHDGELILEDNQPGLRAVFRLARRTVAPPMMDKAAGKASAETTG